MTGAKSIDYQLVPLQPDGGAQVPLPCGPASIVTLTPEQVSAGQGVGTRCASCPGLWTLVPVPPELLRFIGSHTELPEEHIAVLIIDGLLE